MFGWFDRWRWRRTRGWQNVIGIVGTAARPIVLRCIAWHTVASCRPVVAYGPSNFWLRSCRCVQPVGRRRGHFCRRTVKQNQSINKQQYKKTSYYKTKEKLKTKKKKQTVFNFPLAKSKLLNQFLWLVSNFDLEFRFGLSLSFLFLSLSLGSHWALSFAGSTIH